MTALAIASARSHLRLTQWLLGKGANVNAMGRQGRAPLHYACINQHTEIAASALLVAHGSHVDGRGNGAVQIYGPLTLLLRF